MKVDLLKDVANLVAGKNAGPIVNLLFDKKNVNEFLIAKKLGLTINQTRNILYKLSDEGLVSFVRKKDKKKGWYTYFWTFNTDKALLFLQKNLIKEIDNLELKARDREDKRFYICPSCSTEVSEEVALNNNFLCPECGEVYVLNDNKKSINDLSGNITKLKKELADINSELDIINIQKAKKIESLRKKVEKEKTEKRRAAMVERRKAKEKLAKTTKKKEVKKPVKKKTAKKVKSQKKKKQ